MAEEKLSVNKSDVSLGTNGLEIKDKSVLEKLKAHGIKPGEDLSKPAIRIHIVIEF